MTELYLSAFGIAAGEPRDIAELAGQIGDAEVQRLRSGGLARYRYASVPPWRLAAMAAQHTLAGEASEPIDLVVYATDSFWHRDFHATDAGLLLHDLELANVELVAATLQGCANASQAVRTAAAYLRAGSAGRALVVCADACQPGRRLLSSGASVLSDGAASCLLTTQKPATGYQLIGTAAATAPWIATADPDRDVLGILKATADGVGRASRVLQKTTGVASEDYQHAVINNYTHDVSRTLATLAGVPADRVYRRSLADYAHCFSADGFISLSSLLSEGQVGSADPVLLLDSSLSYWGMTGVVAL